MLRTLEYTKARPSSHFHVCVGRGSIPPAAPTLRSVAGEQAMENSSRKLARSQLVAESHLRLGGSLNQGDLTMIDTNSRSSRADRPAWNKTSSLARSRPCGWGTSG